MHARLLQVDFIPYNTMLIDYAFQSLPGHFGHWLEQLVSMYNMLREGSWRKHVQVGESRPAGEELGQLQCGRGKEKEKR
jgi:hypothetical protein